MIFDSLANAAQYKGLNAGIDRVLTEAAAYTADNFPKERRVLDGDALFMNFANYETHAAETACFEAHRRYVDVMVMIEGEETIYVKNTAALQNITKEYDAEGDYLLAALDADRTAVRLTAGSFVVLLPQDAHAPGCDADGKAPVKKIIGKVLIG